MIVRTVKEYTVISVRIAGLEERKAAGPEFEDPNVPLYAALLAPTPTHHRLEENGDGVPHHGLCVIMTTKQVGLGWKYENIFERVFP